MKFTTECGRRTVTRTFSVCANLRNKQDHCQNSGTNDRTNFTKILTLENANPHLKIMEYAVRGPLLIRALEIAKELDNGVKKSFPDVIKANIGDPQAMGQTSLTFIRQVLALVTYTPLMNDDNFPSDAKERASELLLGCNAGSIGAYTNSEGAVNVYF